MPDRGFTESFTRYPANQFRKSRRNLKSPRGNHATGNHVSKWRPWNLCLLALIFLTVYNILLTAKLMYGPECPKTTTLKRQDTIPREIPAQEPCEPRQVEVTETVSFHKFDIRLGRWDNRMLYKLFDNVFVGDKYVELSEEYLVCLATQSSIEKLFSLVQVTSNWHGPISAALFAAGDDELKLLLEYVTYLRKCFPSIRERASFHIALPKDRIPKAIEFDGHNVDSFNCLRPDYVLEALLRRRSSATSKWRVKNPYPQNHLRNLARQNCQSKNVFLTDVDIIPSANLAEGLNTFLKTVTCKKLCAYVVPTYEIDNRVRFPPNKTELVRLANKGLARPFHQKVFIFNQYATNFSRWQNNVPESTEVHISHPVTNFEFLYEPFYVAPNIVPHHDERFIGYGYTRNTQVYEMFVAGYEFLVLSPIFTCHWGLQVKRGRPAWREHQNNVNRKHFETFKGEVFARYNKDPLKMMEHQKPPLQIS